MITYLCNACNILVDAKDAYVTKMQSEGTCEEWAFCPECWSKLMVCAEQIHKTMVKPKKFERQLSEEAIESDTYEPEVEPEQRRVITIEEQRAEKAEKAAKATMIRQPKAVSYVSSNSVGARPTVDFPVRNGRRLSPEAVKYIHEQAADDTPIAEIARRLGVSYATVYNHT